MKLKTTHLFRVLLLPAFILVAWSCSKNDDADDNPPGQQPDQPAVVLVNNNLSGTSSAMGYSLFRDLVADKPGKNVIISPWSLQSALLMATEGAVGSARTDLEALLRLENTSLETVRNEYSSVHASLTSAAYHPTVTSVNAFFHDPDRIAVNQSFANLTETYYDAEVQNLPFSEPSSKDVINDWVSERTNELVPTILEEPIPANQAFYLINALYYKSDWNQGFDDELTFPDDFRRSDGSVVETPMISGSRMFLYTETDDLKMVDLAFKDSTFSLSMIVPKSDDVMDQSWLDGVSPEGMSALYEGLDSEYLNVRFPEMDLGFRENLIPNIKNLGYHAPFASPPADFSGISDQHGDVIALDPVLHEVKLKVDETGAEGAAVTVVGGVLTSAPPVVAFDRPFVLSLRHIPTGVQLFFGLVDQPLP